MTRRYFLDENRIAETLFQRAGSRIIDRATFNQEFDSYMQGTGEDLRDGSFSAYLKNNKRVDKRNIFKEAGGKNLERDQRKTSKRIIRNKEKFIKVGSQRADLPKLDTKRQTAGVVKGRVVKATRVTFINMGKKQTRFRDSKGRFVKVK